MFFDHQFCIVLDCTACQALISEGVEKLGGRDVRQSAARIARSRNQMHLAAVQWHFVVLWAVQLQQVVVVHLLVAMPIGKQLLRGRFTFRWTGHS